MKTKNLLMAAAVATMALTACSNDEEMANVIDVSNTPIHFTTGVNDLTAKTRAGYETGTLAEGRFGLFLTTEGTTDTRFNASNREFTYTNGAWGSTGTQLLWKDNTTTVNYMAYLPYSVDAAEAAGTAKTAYPFSVPTSQATAETIKAADFLYVKGTTTGTESGISGIALGFGHKMSKLTINLTKGTELAEGVTITGVALTECCGLATTINLTDGTVAATSTDGKTSSITAVETTAGVTYECILVPQATTLKVTISATVGEIAKTYVYTATAATTFESGKAYTLPLTVGYDKVTLGSAIKAEPWEPVTGTDNDKLETE